MIEHPGVLSRRDEATPPRTLVDILRETTQRFPEASALEDAAGALSYRELMARVVRSAARLHAAGVRPGDRVGIRMPSGSRELYISILAIMAAGAAYVPVDADDPEERADLVFGEAKVSGIITGAGEFTGREGAGELAPGARTCSPVRRRTPARKHSCQRDRRATDPRRRLVDHLHLRVHWHPQGRRRYPPLVSRVRRCRGEALPAERPDWPRRPGTRRSLGCIRRLV